MDPDSWNTPPEILDRICKISSIGLDPCSNTTSLVDSLSSCTWPHQDGLQVSWFGNGLTFVNPPYSRGNLIRWAEKIYKESCNHTEIIALVPSNVETKVWQKFLWNANLVCFPKRRIKFLVDGKPKGTPKQGSGICYFGHREEAFYNAFQDFGVIIRRRSHGS